jgi:hypothetical protein
VVSSFLVLRVPATAGLFVVVVVDLCLDVKIVLDQFFYVRG